MPGLLAFALSLPEAWEDQPWGDTVVKVRKKIFVFVGPERLTVKLDEAHAHALSIDGAEPTGYGLGKAGWVTVPSAGVDDDVLRDWIEESYRLVAPKRLVALLDSAQGGGDQRAELAGAGGDDA
ncbi:MAG: MmcQ/YjbR family DNA-binding protein [Thermoleophilia bacterium]|nr:MmcQ/YjbR family DNA-binding protein [Thermoleophilia bacterium]